MSLKDRLGKLEQNAKGRRCRACKEWPETQVRYLDGDAPNSEQQAPVNCGVCGFEPLQIVVRYVDVGSDLDAPERA